MSVIRKKPFIESVIESLTDEQKASLLSVMNGSENTVNASFTDLPEDDVAPVLFQLEPNNLKTGILIQGDTYNVLLAYHRFQDMQIYNLDLSKFTFEKINEYLDINELRRTVSGGSGGGSEAGFEEYTIDIYASDFDITDPSTPIINNQEKVSIISALIDKVNNEMKLYSGVVDVPSYTWTDADENEHTEKIWLQGACGYWNDDSSLGRRLILIGDTDYSLGFVKGIDLDVVTVFFGCSLSDAEDRQVALMTLLLTDPTKYIRFKFRIEK